MAYKITRFDTLEIMRICFKPPSQLYWSHNHEKKVYSNPRLPISEIADSLLHLGVGIVYR